MDGKKLKTHEREHDNGNDELKCIICGKRLSSKQVLDLHMKRHTNERPYQCDVCMKGFIQKSNYNNHMKNNHNGAKKYKCSICKKSFLDKQSRQKHAKRAH